MVSTTGEDLFQSLKTILSLSFFDVLQETQIFMKDSNKRLQKFVDENLSLNFEAIRKTRWQSHDNATIKIFGKIDN